MLSRVDLISEFLEIRENTILMPGGNIGYISHLLSLKLLIRRVGL